MTQRRGNTVIFVGLGEWPPLCSAVGTERSVLRCIYRLYLLAIALDEGSSQLRVPHLLRLKELGQVHQGNSAKMLLVSIELSLLSSLLPSLTVLALVVSVSTDLCRSFSPFLILHQCPLAFNVLAKYHLKFLYFAKIRQKQFGQNLTLQKKYSPSDLSLQRTSVRGSPVSLNHSPGDSA